MRRREGRRPARGAVHGCWRCCKEGTPGIFHRFTKKHLHRYVTEFAGRLNARDIDTLDWMVAQVRGMVGRRLTYKVLTR